MFNRLRSRFSWKSARHSTSPPCSTRPWLRSARTRGADATRLSQAIAFDRSTLGDVLERLETRGIVSRKGSPDDKRVKILELTQVGQELLEAVEPAVERTQARILAPLKPDDRKKLLSLLQQILDQ